MLYYTYAPNYGNILNVFLFLNRVLQWDGIREWGISLTSQEKQG